MTTPAFGPWIAHGAGRARPRIVRGHQMRVGETVAGAHTVGEVADQLNVARFDKEALRKAIADCTAWVQVDAAAYGDYVQRAQAHFDKWAAIDTAAIAVVNHSQAPSLGSVIASAFVDYRNTAAPAGMYDGIIAWRHTLADLAREFVAKAKGCGAPSYVGRPTLTAADPSLSAYKAADADVKAIEQAKDFAANRGLYVVAGGAAALLILWMLKK